MESVEEFARPGPGLAGRHMPRAADGVGGFQAVRGSDEEELAQIERCRGAPAHAVRRWVRRHLRAPRPTAVWASLSRTKRPSTARSGGTNTPSETQVPTLTPCMAVILEFGTETRRCNTSHRSSGARPSGCSSSPNPAADRTSRGPSQPLCRDGDEWVLNGSKIWTTGAWWADWALCLARTNWDVPKHRGLTVFMLPIRQPGIEIHRIEMLNGSREFCQEFITDVRVPDDRRIGEVDDGWTVALRWMYHERTIAAGSPYVTAPAGRPAVALDSTGGPPALLPELRRRGLADEPRVREQIGESLAIRLVGDALSGFITSHIRSGAATEHWAAITRLWYGTTAVRDSTIAFDLTGATAAAWSDEERALGEVGTRFLMRQASCIAGGTTEMARNAISERVLELPRERRVDVDVSFRDVPRSTPTR